MRGGVEADEAPVLAHALDGGDRSVVDLVEPGGAGIQADQSLQQALDSDRVGDGNDRTPVVFHRIGAHLLQPVSHALSDVMHGLSLGEAIVHVELVHLLLHVSAVGLVPGMPTKRAAIDLAESVVVTHDDCTPGAKHPEDDVECLLGSLVLVFGAERLAQSLEGLHGAREG